MEYTTLTTEDMLAVARDTLRAREIDYYRMTLLDPQSSGGPARMQVMENEIANVRAKITALESQPPSKVPPRRSRENEGK